MERADSLTLYIEAAAKEGGSLALFEGHREIARRTATAETFKAENLLAEISALLADNQFGRRHLKAIITNEEQGSATGKKLIGAVVKGLEKSLRLEGEFASDNEVKCRLSNSRNKLKLERMALADIKSVLSLAAESGLCRWTEADYKAEITKFDSYTTVARISGQVVGFIVARFALDGNDAQFSAADIFNICVSEKFRQRGIGTFILKNFLAFAREKKAAEIWLEVRESNRAAIAFYRHNGFIETQMRKNFYAQPSENALLMRLKIKPADGKDNT